MSKTVNDSDTDEEIQCISWNEPQVHEDLIGESSVCPICYEKFRSKSSSDYDRFDEIPTSSPICLPAKGIFAHPQERIRLPDCHHEFCRECLKHHCQHAISIRKIPIECPSRASDSCELTVPVSLIRALLLQQGIRELQEVCGPPTQNVGGNSSEMFDAATSLSNRYGSMDKDDVMTRNVSDPPPEYQQGLQDWLAFQRMYRLILDDTLTPCTRCQEPVSTQLENEGQEERKHENHLKRGRILRNKRSCDPVVCLSCGHSFCQVHGDAHPNVTCEEYLKEDRCRPNEQCRKSERVIRQYCKPCSHCQAPIHKDSGCDHIICPACHQDMCFKCGTHQYLHGKSMVRNCRNCDQSFIDHRYMGRYRVLICLALPLYLPFYLVHVILVGSLAMISCGCFCCLGCGIQKKKTRSEDQEELGSIKSKSVVEEKFEFQPRRGLQTVLFMIFMPFINLFHQCGISCCCAIRHWQENQFEDGNDDEDDEERQLRPNLTMATVPDIDGSSEE
jgi:hypothetical protein